LADVLRGADTVPSGAAVADSAALHRELDERDRRIGALEASCQELERAGAKEAEAAREAAALQLLEGVAAPLSQLATMRSLFERGTVPEVGDVLRLTEAVQKAFEGAGLQAVGSVGEVAPFDPGLHRPAGRAQFSPGESAKISFIGFRVGDRVVRPALVTKEDA
jgi:molecular chaperone GrpE (heat shock protein)